MVCARAVIFDLDNVLYDERTYFEAAFRRIAHFLSDRSNLFENEIFNRLIDDLQKKGSMYPRLFNDVVLDFGLSPDLVPDILKLFETLECPIELFPETVRTLEALKVLGSKLALVTNGNVRTQRNKIRLLGLDKFFDAIVFARETDLAVDKPHPEPYRVALKKLGVLAEDTFCLGDNPYTDFLGAKQLRIHTVRLLRGEFKDVHVSLELDAEVCVKNLEEFLSLVRS